MKKILFLISMSVIWGTYNPKILLADYGGLQGIDALTELILVDGAIVTGFIRVYEYSYDGSGKISIQLENKKVLFDLSKKIIDINLTKADRRVAQLLKDETKPAGSDLSIADIPNKRCMAMTYKTVPLSHVSKIHIFIDPQKSSLIKKIETYTQTMSDLKQYCPAIYLNEGGGDAVEVGVFDPSIKNYDQALNFLILISVAERWHLYHGLSAEKDKLMSEPLKPVPPKYQNLAKRLWQHISDGVKEISPADAKAIEQFKREVNYWSRCESGWYIVVAGPDSPDFNRIREKYLLETPQTLKE